MFTNKHFRQPIYHYIFDIAIIAGIALATLVNRIIDLLNTDPQ